MKVLYLQTIRLDTDMCRSSRIGLVEGLTRLGCEVTVVAGYDWTRPRAPEGVRLIAIPAPQIAYVKQLSFNIAAHAIVFWQILNWRPHVVLLDPYTFHCAWPWDLFARAGLHRMRVLMDVRSGIFHERHRGVANVMLRALRRIAFGYGRAVFAGFTTISSMLRDTLVRDYGLSPDRIGIWQSGVAPFAAAPAARRGTAADFRVMYHGSFGIDRGLPETIEAMRLIAATRSDIRLLLLGAGTEEPKLRRLAEGLPNVRFHAPVPHDEVPAFIADSDIGIVPFMPTPVMRSSSPLKLMEYLSAGRSVIASRIEAISDVVGDDGAIYLDDQTPEAIARAICWAADHRELVAALGRRGPTLIAERYTWANQARGLRDFLATVGT